LFRNWLGELSTAGRCWNTITKMAFRFLKNKTPEKPGVACLTIAYQ